MPQEGRVARFREAIDLIRALWSRDTVSHHGRFYQLDNARLGIRPVQTPLPVWTGVGHPDAIKRSASLADGWMGAGGSSTEDFRRAVPLLREALEKSRTGPAERFPISKRIFMAVDENPAVARAALQRWYAKVYHNPEGTDTSGVHGTVEQVRERLEEFVGMGANHLLLNPVARHVEQLDALAEVVGFPSIQTSTSGVDCPDGFRHHRGTERPATSAAWLWRRISPRGPMSMTATRHILLKIMIVCGQRVSSV